MKKFDTRTYSINDFYGWHERNEIILQPKFQRRSVWSYKARSYLLDTIIRGKPFPKIFIREITDIRRRRTIREVVDGQQRLKSIFSYLDDEIVISRVHNKEHGGLRFNELADDVKLEFLQYEIAVDLLLDASDEEVLDIFSRLNSYSVTLNNQEKLNAEFFGEFKQIVYNLAKEFHTFFELNKILTPRQMLRMGEVELISELLIAMIDGIRARTHKTLRDTYKRFDDKFPASGRFVDRFEKTIDHISELFGDSLPESNFRRPHVFYSLFCSIYHFAFGLPDFEAPRVKLTKRKYGKIRSAFDEIDLIWDSKEVDLEPEGLEFLQATRRATTDASVRRHRSRYMCKVISEYVQG